MLASRELAMGVISILSMDSENEKVQVQFNKEKPVYRALRRVPRLDGMYGIDKGFKFKGTLWFLGYDFNLPLDDDGRMVPPVAEDEMVPFFVYGTLRTGMGNHRYFFGRLENSVPAKVEGEIYHNGYIPYMYESNNTVRGELMYVKPEKYTATLLDLDRLEGFYENGYAFNHYNRKLVTAITNDGSEVKAWAYYANENHKSSDKRRLVRIKDGDFVRWYNEYHGEYDYRYVRGRKV
ncbi:MULTISPECIES: gamma-glutamylcyclotransferase family protein [Paenibacillus]|uniref:gamma-glutamylcyclotransferase family protein n=1 Tax=Paenibacillus TaxID=44249 RepID=UPI000F932F78|nr:gamma-glutamylcyclotransferase family protein [Paenibacillus xylanexedens]RPK20124.1 hypothetical protein EDO6_06663 [Paenibacillus xylanexedens]